MSSSRPAVTPTTPSYPPSDAVFSTITPPPPPKGSAAAGPSTASTTHTPYTAYTGYTSYTSHTSPSPRTRRSSSRDVGTPGPRSHFSHRDNAIDNNVNVNVNAVSVSANPRARPDRPSAPAAHPHPYPPPRPPHPPAPFEYSTFPSNGNPPRTSSLLPPARIVVDPGIPDEGVPNLRDPFNDPRPAPKIPDQPRGHSRSSSTGGLSDTFRNLNRWSASTTSSRASHLADFTRRVSAEILGAAFHSSPGKKLHKSRPSTSGGSPRSSLAPRNRTESPAATAVPPLQSLPRISTGPSLEHEVLESNVLGGRHSPPERAGHDPQQPSEDYRAVWDAHSGAPQEEHGLSLHYAHHADPLPRAPDMISHESSTMPYTQNGQAAKGHSRSRSTGAKGSADTTVSSRSRDKDRERGDRANKPPSQKAMLSKALAKANTAVQLDNAQNFEGARRAYAEACAVLQQVLLRTSGEEDRRKLEAIHETYLGRVMELDEQLVDVEPEGKALPQRPESNDLHDVLSSQIAEHGYSHPYAARDTHDEDEFEAQPSYPVQEPARNLPPPSRASPLPTDAPRDPREGPSSHLTQQYSLQSAFSRARYNNGSTLHPPGHMDNAYMPPPLSPRRALSPARLSSPPLEHDRFERPASPEAPVAAAPAPRLPAPSGHQRANSHESVSWLDPIDESEPERSTTSSVHSRSSSRIRRKHIRAASGATEAEFDAALDDAIEAAYDDGYEPESQYLGHSYHDAAGDAMANTLRRVEMARELVRESEREALELANEREKRLRLQQQLEDEEYRRQEAAQEFYDGHDSEDEERMLEEMDRHNAIEDFAFQSQPRPPVPRESDSSGMTGRTWHSSMGSNPPTGTTVLTPVSEDSVLPHPHPSGPLPALPPHAKSQLPPEPGSAGTQSSAQSVRNRRLSGQNPKELKIETTKLAPAAPATAGASVPPHPKAGNYIVQQRQALSAGPSRTVGPFSARSGPSPIPPPLEEETDEAPLPALPYPQEDYPRVGTPSVVRPNLRKNYSASSLKSLKTRNLSISHDETSDFSPGTPLTTQFGARLPAVPALPPGITQNRANSTTTAGLHLFENHFHSPEAPGSPNPLSLDAPAPLEPCPSESLLRPFWLMRALYQTLCHPRGGYLSNKLFVPRDVWRVKGVKLKNLEDKIANCDLLTAALQRLARVDTCDADAVLEEMQALEGVLEQVQAVLARKLGSEVGVQGAGAMLREARDVEVADAASMPRSASAAGKGSSFSWRRLRSKNSSANLPGLGAASSSGGGYGLKAGGTGAGAVSSTNLSEVVGNGKDAVLASLPMTNHPTSRPVKRDVAAVGFAGPNAHYAASLARLFDAAQTVDQIARQVDDPGLRHGNKTQVGIELCTRHAAEFFAFYICRFALADLTVLLDKFVKRGTEWVLA